PGCRKLIKDLVLFQRIDKDVKPIAFGNGKIPEGPPQTYPRLKADNVLGVGEIHQAGGVQLQEFRDLVEGDILEVDVLQFGEPHQGTEPWPVKIEDQVGEVL